jgi:signal transduction histidine kinase
MEPRGKILVIDDETGIRHGCRRALEPQGFTVETAATLQEGLRKIRESDFDLVLLDVMMPDGQGIELLEPARQKDPDLVCVIITGYATVELAVEAIKRGAYDFISKPFASDVLLMAVNQGLERRHLSLETKRLQAIEREAAELARAKAEMERLSEFKSAFMLTVAHELRSPVGGAQSLVRTLLRGLAGELNQQQSELLSRVESRLNQLLELINDLLTLAESRSVEPDRPLERTLLQPAIRRVVDRLSVEAENKQIRLTFDAPEQLVAIQATEDGLERVFSNLIGNAIKYTPSGGSVRVEVAEDAGRAQITVSDTGLGIPADDLPKIGEEFFRARNVRQARIMGTGLGLSIVKQLVDRFEGRIAIQSAEGEGTCVTLLLPSEGLRDGN